ncbi:ABC-three component system middle component 1 [Sphingobacterium yanglingense]|uniref:Uncharacterized protein n=1 Tax=Sphingobacterium yanglingense TaxID=1437280 RepID=A0A4R6WG21_9SPHI|nr:ABC-three component system middle component 1 [Sphingobacterium yanglingense]TDQ79083.1 hypothetical protein CLV99_0515 [Sphingobacterium yanglingense]
MRQSITTLFSAFGFTNTQTDSEVMFFTRTEEDRAEYYLVLIINKTGLVSEIEQKFEIVNALFDNKKRESRDIEKNTSLIIFVEFESYREDCPKYKNRLLQIEENEYFYRKYVIPYTPIALSNFTAEDNFVNSIEQTISNEKNFDAFNSDMFENEPYFFAMQLYIKLPFLNLNINRSENFFTIAAMLSEKIGTNEQLFLARVLDTPQLEQNERDQLLQKVLDPNDNSFDIFINSFIGDAPAT